MLYRLQPEVFHRSVRSASAVLIDLRPQSAFAKGSIAGAVSLPVEHSTGREGINTIRTQWPSCTVYAFDSDGTLDNSFGGDELPLHYLHGGYAAYTSWQEELLGNGPPVIILGGHAGTGKTELLQQLTANGEQVLDLEQLAAHKGSVFGNLTGHSQPSNAEFRARIVDAWMNFDVSQAVWIEEEGPFLGTATVPPVLYERMLDAPMLELTVDFETRLSHIVSEYGEPSPEFAAAIRKLEQRMGMSANHKALHLYTKGETKACFELLLRYYDNAYIERRQRYRRGPMHELNLNEATESAISAMIGWRRNVQKKETPEYPGTHN